MSHLEAIIGASVSIGHKLKLRRKVRSLSLKDVAERSGLSIGLVSQIERGISTPSLRSLTQICTALDMPIRWLFEGPDEGSEGDGIVVRAMNRRHLDLGSKGMVKELLSPDEILGIQMMRIIIQPGGASGPTPYRNPSGAKCGVVVSGEFGLEVDGREYRLSAGDSFAFEAVSLHRFWCEGKSACEVIWVVSPAVY
ncbi:cupin domain-containing protein [Aureimonas fodinaquatilis]|uniref:Cupin domain-containing protein n=1 Tax=Aureimonas fodinaquatilis TaxID=2565783 RepID=A0A5B0E1K6_9HYPH|nr:cupin domain-containing protein [Aureimonas fodinaquatilis]KAA0972005.1 cupin domain-containing protein [Aureimonas fodinaquatilis]